MVMFGLELMGELPFKEVNLKFLLRNYFKHYPANIVCPENVLLPLPLIFKCTKTTFTFMEACTLNLVQAASLIWVNIVCKIGYQSTSTDDKVGALL